MDIKVRPIRRRCDVRNCRNTASYHISRTRELGYTVVICEDCLREALAKIERPLGREGKVTIVDEPNPKAMLNQTGADLVKTNITTKNAEALTTEKAAKKTTKKKVDA